MDQCCALGKNHVAAMFFDGEDVKIYEVGGLVGWSAVQSVGRSNKQRQKRRRSPLLYSVSN